MPQISLYLDDAALALVEQAAKANRVSQSRWVTDIIRKHAAHDGPQDCLDVAGLFADFPLREQPQIQRSADPQALTLVLTIR